MKKVTFSVLLSLCFVQVGTVCPELNSDHIKLGVSGVATVACALGSWYCFDQAGKFDDDEYQKRKYKILAWVLAGGAVGSGAYCGYKVYGLWNRPGSQEDGNGSIGNGDTRNGGSEVSGGDGEQQVQGQENKSLYPFIKQQFSSLARQGASNDFQIAYNGYGQRILPIVEKHLQSGTVLDGDVQGFVNCYEECINAIEQLDFNHVAPEDKQEEYNRQQRETTANILKDHMTNLLADQWKGEGYDGVTGALENLKGVGQEANPDMILERSPWINGLFVKVRDLELNRVIQAPPVQTPPKQEQKKPKQEPEPEVDINGQMKAYKDFQKEMESIQKEHRKLEEEQKKKEEEDRIQQALENNEESDQRIWEFANLKDDDAKLEMLKRVSDVNACREMRNIARIFANHDSPDPERLLNEIMGQLRGSQKEARAKRIVTNTVFKK